MVSESAQLEVMGRMLRDPRVSITAGDNQVVIAVDDGHNSEFWLHMTLSTDRLIGLLEMIASQRVDQTRELLSSLAVLRQMME